ncbi:MAG: heavy metal transporter [Arcobacter sp.]|nr:MAG: heavy metal transporter [Arcobacter sp.]
MDKKIMTGVFASVGASLCCITPVLALLAGTTGLASTFTWIEPFRPYLITLTVLVLGYAWWRVLKTKKDAIKCACDSDELGKKSFYNTKSFLGLITVFATIMLSFPYWGSVFIQADEIKVQTVKTTNIVKNTIGIKGLTCPSCERTVETVAMQVDGVIKIKASTENKNAVVEFDKTKTSITHIMKAIGETGYMPINYEDNLGKHKVEGIIVSQHQ